MKHRSGITLVEVLVAIFIMGVGLLAILTLFPLGVMTVAQALQDDRVAQLGAKVNALVNARNLRNDSSITGAFSFTDKKTGNVTNYSAVYVDPFYAPITTNWLVGSPSQPQVANSIPRVNLPQASGWTNAQGNATRWFSMTDDYVFDTNGIADGALTSGIVNSTGNYTCCVLLRRQPRAGDSSGALTLQDQTFNDMAIVIFKGRSTQVVQGETQFSVNPVGTIGSPSIVVALAPNQPGANPVPAIRKSGWILDISFTGNPLITNSTNPTYGIHADFYRVIGVTDQGNGNFQLDLEVPLKRDQVNQVLVLENVVDVIQRGFGSN